MLVTCFTLRHFSSPSFRCVQSLQPLSEFFGGEAQGVGCSLLAEEERCRLPRHSSYNVVLVHAGVLTACDGLNSMGVDSSVCSPRHLRKLRILRKDGGR